MWFFAQKVDPEVQQPQVTSGDNKQVTSGGNNSARSNSAAPVPRPTSDEEHREDSGFEVNQMVECTILGNSGSVLEVSNVKDHTTPRVEASQVRTRRTADDASKVSKISFATVSTQGINTRSVTSEEEQFAIEVEAAGTGFSLSRFDQIKDNVTVLSSDDDSDLETEMSRRPCIQKRWLICISASVIVAATFLMVGLAVGVRRNSKIKNTIQSTVASAEASENAAVNATTPSAEESSTSNLTSAPSTAVSGISTSWNIDQEDNDATWIDDSAAATNSPTDSPTASTSTSPSMEVTDSPTASTSTSPSMEVTLVATDTPTASPSVSQTVEVTVAGTTEPTELTCEESHNLLVTSQCQRDGSESWSFTRVSYCFSRARDGDWYWIRGSDSDYDRWDYTEGASTGTMEFDSIPPGDYLVSLVRDSMQPYDVLITESVTVSDCSTTSV